MVVVKHHRLVIFALLDINLDAKAMFDGRIDGSKIIFGPTFGLVVQSAVRYGGL
jgi:hypothetical protein